MLEDCFIDIEDVLGSTIVIGTTNGLLSVAVLFDRHSGRGLGQRNSPLGADVVVVEVLVVVEDEVVVVITTVRVCTLVFLSIALVVSIEGAIVEATANAFGR